MASDDHARSVFVNCPFDGDFQPIRDAIVFAIIDCGFIARCALETANSGEVRIEKIAKIIRECRFGVHDISRTELSADTGLPRFNMPFELGLFLGAARFGGKSQRTKNCLILDSKPFRYQSFLSDIAGQDICAHDNNPRQAILQIRNWLATNSLQTKLPGGKAIADHYQQFQLDLPKLAANAKCLASELTFTELRDHIALWITRTLTVGSLS